MLAWMARSLKQIDHSALPVRYLRCTELRSQNLVDKEHGWHLRVSTDPQAIAKTEQREGRRAGVDSHGGPSSCHSTYLIWQQLVVLRRSINRDPSAFSVIQPPHCHSSLPSSHVSVHQSL